jgi:heme-degrading monooxygenase HmoA
MMGHTKGSLGKVRWIMWVRMTHFRLDPANRQAARAFYNGEQISGVMRQQPGYRFNYLLESVDAPGEAISVSVWDSREDADAYERSGVYEQMLERFGEYYVRPPELRSYEVPE